MRGFAKTQAEAASELGMSRQALVECCREPDFPKKGAKGLSLAACDKWLKAKARGPYRKSGGGKATEIEGRTLTEVNILRGIEEAEIAKLKRVRLQLEQAELAGELVRAVKVERLYGQTVSVIVSVVEGAKDAIDRSMGEFVSKEIRDRVLSIVEKIIADAHAMLKELA